MGALQLTYKPKFKIVHRTGELMRSHEAKSVQLWLSTDPLTEKYPNVNPYVYCIDNPINLVDPDGRSFYPPGGFPRKDGAVHKDSDGSWIYNAADNVWKGQNGSEDYSNSIQLSNVMINNKYDGYLAGYFNGPGSGEYGPSTDPYVAVAVCGIVILPVLGVTGGLTAAGSYVAGEVATAYAAMSTESALVGIGTNTLSQGIANGGDMSKVNVIEALSSAVPGSGATVVGEYFNFNFAEQGKGIQTPESFEQGALQIGGGLFSNKFGNKIDANPIFKEGVGKTYKEVAKFTIETGTNTLPNLSN